MTIKNHLNWILLAVIVLVSFGLMLNASLQESATMDELAHIPAGYGYVKYLDYRLNPEHPPLVKAIATFPLLFKNLGFPTDKPAWQIDINGQWTAGAQFLYESGNNADEIIQWSRLGPMLLTIILLIFIYVWTKELLGRWWALMPTFLFGLSPTVLAHGHYVTTDIGAALGIFVALYYFIKFLSSPSKEHLLFAGIAFGIAQLLKFSAVLLIPFFIFLIVVFYIHKTALDWKNTEPSKRIKRFFIRAFRYAKSVFVIFIIGYAIVYAAYFIFTYNYPIEKQKFDTESILTSFAGGPKPEISTCRNFEMRCLADANILMSGNKYLRPFAEYMLGVLMVMQRSNGGNTGYFLGEVSSTGWWYYFPILFLLKEPVPSLILILLAFLIAFWKIIKKSRFSSLISNFFEYLTLHFAEFSMLSFAIFYWLYSVKSPLNIGIRHILPTMPFIYILIASAAKKTISSSVKKIILAALLLWFALETLFAAPYYLSYSNQFGGGIWNGYKYAVDSNYDWGQDLKRLKKFVDNPPAGEQIDKIAIDYFGGGNPKYYLGDKVEYWQSSRDNPIYENINWLAVSINTLQNATGEIHPGQQRNPEDEYQWLQKIKNPHQPDYRAGTSIFIFKL
ncbi:MAG: glycosyltransferase family 39 protein [Patescibacteria group bacterium]|nr:glycosyltransferase family 39 protein [Patescibacteria group bacterium]